MMRDVIENQLKTQENYISLSFQGNLQKNTKLTYHARILKITRKE